MPSAHLTLREEDVVRLALEFLHNRELHISQLSLERETGVINGAYSDDVLFLRQLVLDGQWDDVLEFIQPLEALPAFDMRRFRYTVLKHKYVELLCIKSEANVNGDSVEGAVEEVVKVLGELEKLAESKEDYSNLCLLLTLPRLSDHLSFKDWNPSNARVQCFRDVFPLVEKFLPGDRKMDTGSGRSRLTSKNDRLVQLIIKGVLYESCVNYCQAKATGSEDSRNVEMNFSRLLDGSAGFSDSDLSLLSWLQSIPSDAFAVPFEQRTLNVDVERLERPSLETSWTEHMLVTPIKPKTFPHSAMPFTRPRSAADAMSRSLLPALEAGPTSRSFSKATLMALSVGDVPTDAVMSRSSFASFHLSAVGHKSNKLMNTSVDRLFDNDNEVFLSSSFTDFQLPSISETTSHLSKCQDDKKSSPSAAPVAADLSNASTPEHKSSSTTARSSRRDSLSDKIVPPTYTDSFDGDLLKEYQKQKQRLQECLSKDDAKCAVIDNSRLYDESLRGGGTPPGLLKSNQMKTPVPTVPVSPASVGVKRQPEGGGHLSNGGTDYHAASIKASGNLSNLRNPGNDDDSSAPGRPRFLPVTTLEDVQAVRCAEFHPNGNLYAVGSNSKTLRICAYPKLSDLKEDHNTYQPTVLYKRTRHHKGSIYCMAWTPVGDLMATGSNDKTVKLMKFNVETSNFEGQEIELTMHDGTVRDVCFLEDISNKSSLLISGGAGDCKIYVTDCATGQAYQALSGHSGHILTLYNWGGAMFVSGAQDRTVRFWDLRTHGCINVVTPITSPNTRQGSPVASVCVEPSGRLLVSGHEDASCVLYDIRGGRTLQSFKPHTADVRSIRFSPSAYYLLTGGYDNRLVLTDLQGDLTTPLPSVVVAQHSDKVISGRWHPTDFSFLSTSADKTATLWALPPL